MMPEQRRKLLHWRMVEPEKDRLFINITFLLSSMLTILCLNLRVIVFLFSFLFFLFVLVFCQNGREAWVLTPDACKRKILSLSPFFCFFLKIRTHAIIKAEPFLTAIRTKKRVNGVILGCVRFFLHHKNFKWSSITAAFRIQNLMIVTNWQYILYYYVCTSFWSVFGKPFCTLLWTFITEHITLLLMYTMLFMLWCAVKETGESRHECPCYCKIHIPMALPLRWTVFLSRAKHLSFSTVHDCLRCLEMYCTNALNITCEDI